MGSLLVAEFLSETDHRMIKKRKRNRRMHMRNQARSFS